MQYNNYLPLQGYKHCKQCRDDLSLCQPVIGYMLANTSEFHIHDFSIHGFYYLWGRGFAVVPKAIPRIPREPGSVQGKGSLWCHNIGDNIGPFLVCWEL